MPAMRADNFIRVVCVAVELSNPLSHPLIVAWGTQNSLGVCTQIGSRTAVGAVEMSFAMEDVFRVWLAANTAFDASHLHALASVMMVFRLLAAVQYASATVPQRQGPASDMQCRRSAQIHSTRRDALLGMRKA